MHRPSRLPIGLLRAAAILACWSIGAPILGADSIDYLTQIKPILAARCFACHGGLKQEAGLRLDTAELVRKGSESGPVVNVGKSAGSSLIKRVTASGDQRMPPEGDGEPLKPAEVSLLRAWIDQGATGPADEKPESDPRSHWAFRPPVKPPIPAVKNTGWGVNPIDAFISAKLDEHGLSPRQEAEPSLLLRRVYLDLIGLPPTREEIERFVSEYSPSLRPSISPSDRVDGGTERLRDRKELVYAAAVDRLIASPQYGQRWGRHWMDVWRYSDWWGLGAEVRNSQKHIWHWRDWIVDSLNADQGYDQMVREMLAADELYPTDADRLRASGYLARHYFKFNRTSWLDEVIEHTAKGFLGLTFNCAKCHDHKYDPFSQNEYYRLRAFFEPYQIRTDQWPGQIDLEKDGLPRAFDCNLAQPTYLHIRGDDTRPKLDQPLTPGLPSFLTFDEFPIQPVSLPAEAYHPGLKPYVLSDYLRDAETKLLAARQECERLKQACQDNAAADTKTQAELRTAEARCRAAELLPAALKARAAADQARFTQPSAENALELAKKAARAERELAVAVAEEALAKVEADLLKAPADKKPDVEKQVAAAKAAVDAARKGLENPGEKYTSLQGSLKTLESNLEKADSRGKPFPTTSTGRRSALARWLTDPRHPLTARVAVNHIWTRHFGRPLVPTVFDFGRKGQPPTHPELLDFLAVEFMESGWSMKHLHRLMVTSATYRQSAISDFGFRIADSITNTGSNPKSAIPNPQSIDPENRFYWRRNSQRMEAQTVRDSLLHLAGELDTTLGGPSIAVTDESSRRRSLYFVHSHNEHQKFLSIFDDASVLECYRRSESIVPQQALALANSKLVLTMAEKIAVRLSRQHGDGDDAAFIDAAWLTILATPPSADERTTCQEALQQWRNVATANKTANASSRARVKLVEALLNHNDFVTIR